MPGGQKQNIRELESVINGVTARPVTSGRFDAGIRIGERIAKDMMAVRLLDAFRVIAVASPEHLSRHLRPETPEDLHGHSCVRLRWDWDGSIQPWVFEHANRRLGIPVDGSLVLNDMYFVMNAVLDGVGIGWCFSFVR